MILKNYKNIVGFGKARTYKSVFAFGLFINYEKNVIFFNSEKSNQEIKNEINSGVYSILNKNFIVLNIQGLIKSEKPLMNIPDNNFYKNKTINEIFNYIENQRIYKL